jgi:hypothetical protein
MSTTSEWCCSSELTSPSTTTSRSCRVVAEDDHKPKREAGATAVYTDADHEHELEDTPSCFEW